MSLVSFNFQSDYLFGNTDINVILPDKPMDAKPEEYYRSGKKYKVLWLLHGTFGDHSDWIRKSNIELYACEKDLIVVMPSGMNSNYGNWPTFGLGYNMFDFLTKELMPLIYGWFPASDKREDNFIAGLSMGGRGTCVYAFNHPEKFAAAAILSASPRDFRSMKETEPGMYARMMKSVPNYESYDDFMKGPENTFDLLDQLVKEGADLPRLYFACGEDDHLLPSFTAFRKHAEEIGLKAEFETIPGFKHEWRFWDLTIQHALKFFGL